MKKIKKAQERLWCHDKLGHARVVSLIRTSPACRDKVDAIRKKFNIPKGGFIFYADILKFREIFSNERRNMLNDPEFIKLKALEDKHGVNSANGGFKKLLRLLPSSIWKQMLSDLASMTGADEYLKSHIEEYVICENEPLFLYNMTTFDNIHGNYHSKPYFINIIKEGSREKFVIEILDHLSKKHWSSLQKEINECWSFVSTKTSPKKIKNRELYERILFEIKNGGEKPHKELYKRVFPDSNTKIFPYDDFKKQIIAAKRFIAKEKGEK
jgi:hypothetical protein